MLLTVLVFFNSHGVVDGGVVSRGRLWLAILFLSLIAAAFVTSATVDRFKPMLAATAKPPPTTPADRHAVRDDARPGRPADPLSRTERLNVMFVLAVSQIAQIGWWRSSPR